MADEPIARLSIDVVANLKIQKSQAAKAAEEAKKALKEATQTDGWDGISKTMDLVKNGLSKFGKMAKEVGKQGLGLLTDRITKSAKSLGVFFNQIKRIAVYRLIRSALKAITQGFQEGIQNAYQWSVITGNQFARSMDMMSTSALYLKNSLGAMTMPLMNYLAPILDRITDQFVNLINVVNRFIATITGASSWTKALKYPAQYLESAAGSAKELKNQLLGFDELNVLNAPSGGSGGSALDYSKMFENVDLANNGFTNALKDAIKNGNWKEVGKLFGIKFNTMIEGIDAQKMASALGESINNALGFLSSFLDEVNFFAVGQKITTFLSNLHIDWATISSSIFKWATRIGDFLLGMVSGINWSNVGHAIGEFIKGVFNGVTGFVKWISEIDWLQFARDLGKAIKDMFMDIDWKGVAESLFGRFKTALNNVVTWLKQTFGKLWDLLMGKITLQQLINNATSEYIGVHISAGGNVHSGGGGRTFAEGGFPEQGSMFIAGEAGAEFVGNIGGRTGVYNAEQMTVALSNANEEVVNTLAAVGNAIVGAIHDQRLSINANDVRKALNTMNLRYGV